MSQGEGAYMKNCDDFATRAIHVGQDPEKWESLAVVPPIVLSTTYKQHSPAEPKQFEYSRSGNPSREVLEQCLASLDNGKYGMCFASGLGAVTALLSMFNTKDHIICGDDVYGGTGRVIRQVFIRLGLEVTFVDTTDSSNIEKAFQPNTKLVFIESPSNPLLKITDMRKVAKITTAHKVMFVVDNTFLTSYFQRPLELGADIVLYSLTKYMNGHSDVVMGAMVTNNEKYYNQLKFLQNAMGIVPSPFDCSMVTRSLKTLALRMKEHMASSLVVGKFLEKHPAVEKVIHPGLPSHPQYQLSISQTYGYSGMVSFYIKGDLAESKKFLKALKIFTLAESLGGYESLVEIPSIMTHASVPEEQRKILGISDNLIRLSVGLESVEDLVKDLTDALAAALSN